MKTVKFLFHVWILRFYYVIFEHTKSLKQTLAYIQNYFLAHTKRP